jgi:hypothetical protein
VPARRPGGGSLRRGEALRSETDKLGSEHCYEKLNRGFISYDMS